MKVKLPLYNMLIADDIDGEEEVDYVALVEYPAIQRNFLAFNNTDEFESYADYPDGVKDGQSSDLKFAIQDEEQRIVTGPLMIADLPIYRKDEDGEYYVMFSAEEIKKIVQRFFKKGYQGKVNIEHGKPIEDVYMYESYIVDREKGVMPPKGFEDVSNGSWFGSYKVDNDKIWSEVKAGTFKGFSIEGMFKYQKSQHTITEEEVMMEKVINILSQIEH
jgi:hypothetical protein